MRHRSSGSSLGSLLALFALMALCWSCGRSPVPVGGVSGEPEGPSGGSGSGSLDPGLPGSGGGTIVPNPDDPDVSPDDRPDRPPPDDRPDPPPPDVPDPPPPPPPKQPDLWVKSFEAKLVDGDIRYRVEVCNAGLSSAVFFRVDYYYNNPTAPLPLIAGDASQFVPVLDGGKCKQLSHQRQDAPVGIYASRLTVDTLRTVAEANEDNNAAGPKLVFVSSSASCAAFCAFAPTCGVVGWTEYTRCLDWCGGMDEGSRDCALAAAQKLSCGALKQCALPPLPPPQPPATLCYSVCNYLISDCKLLPADQLLTCLGGCVGLAATKKQCAYQAMQNQQCSAMMLCLL